MRLSNSRLSLYLTLTGHGPRRRTWLTVWYIALAACLFASDPLFLYGVGIPVVAVSLLYLLFPSAHRAFIPLRGSSGPSAQRWWRPHAHAIVVAGLELALPIHVSAASTSTTSASIFIANLQFLVSNSSEIFGITPWSVGLHDSAAWLTALYGLLLLTGILGLVAAWRRDPGAPSVPSCSLALGGSSSCS